MNMKVQERRRERADEVQALGKGLQILRAFTGDRQRLTLSEVAGLLGWSKPHTLRLLRTLAKYGFVEVDEAGRYHLGLFVLELGSAYLATLRFPDMAEPFLTRLSRRTGETVNLAVRDGPEVVYVARVSATPRLLETRLQVGSRLPAYATALGKATLWDARPEDLVEIFGPPPWPRFTPNTRVNEVQLFEDIRAAHKLGVAVCEDELEFGIRSIAAPVRDEHGRVVAAMNMSTNGAIVPYDRLIRELAPLLITEAQAFSRAIGYRPQGKTGE